MKKTDVPGSVLNFLMCFYQKEEFKILWNIFKVMHRTSVIFTIDRWYDFSLKYLL